MIDKTVNISSRGDPRADVNAGQEYDWQSQNLPGYLREVLVRTVIIRTHPDRISVSLRKGRDF
jgi:hypothetical protein